MNWNELIGRQLGRYLLVGDIGVGGSSRVYRATDTETDQEVAVKVLPNDAEDRVGFVRRFEREVQVVAQLNHPNIVAVYDHGKTEDVVFLVMQLVGGGTLRARMGRPLPIAEATAAIAQMAFALQHAHLRGIIHRDVKPSNMLVSAEDARHLLLSDFGIAKLQGLRGPTKTGTTIGTPEYMSPEQAEGREIDPRADVYSLGCVLYEALSGRPPFTGATPVSVLYQQVHARQAYLRGLNAEVPRDLNHIVELALAKRPEDRFATAERFAEALLPFAAGAMPSLSMPSEPNVSSPPQPYGPHSVVAEQDTSPQAALPRGLGEEGLDALFPNGGATGRTARRVITTRPLTGAEIDENMLPAENAPAARTRRQTVPLPPFRLPTKTTRKLDLPLTADGRLDEDALLAASERERLTRQGYRPAPRERAGQRTSSPVWRPPLDERTGARERPKGRGGHRTLKAGVAVAALLLISLAVWVGVNASALGLTLGQKSSVAHPTATRTVAPTATATATVKRTTTPSGTSTPTQQQLLDRQAAASFRAITLTTFVDNSCSAANAQSHFATYATVVINLCTSDSALDVPATVAIRQHGQVLYVLASNYYFGQGARYWFSRYGVASGSYDMLVTMTINGTTATAADLRFTVG